MFDFKISLQLLENLKSITREITELNSKSFPEVVLLEMEELANAQSSFSSTSIEGNPLPLTEVKRLIKYNPKNLRDTEREIINYNESLLWLKEELLKKNLNFNSNLIFEIHQRVTNKLLPKFQSGKYRKEPVFVNDPKLKKTIFWPPDHADVVSLMNQLIKFIHENKKKIDPIILAGLFHKQFVIIHPFIDGNGRTVRLLTKALLADLGIDTFHLFSFENFYNRNVASYFSHVGEKGNYYDLDKKISHTAWLEYFSAGILDELLRVKKLLEAESYGKNPNQIVSTEQQKILKFIEKIGHIRDKDYAKLTERAKATRALDFKKLINLNLIEKKGAGPGTFYILKKLA